MNDPRRSIPSVERLLSSDPFRTLLLETPRAQVIMAIQAVQQQQRGNAAEIVTMDDHAYAAAVRDRLQEQGLPSLRPVINATGVVLHTNLGRSPLAQEALSAIQLTAAGYSNLEYDLNSGTRGSRYDHCCALLCELAGAEDALVVNNNASALLLALNTLAAEQSVIVSRGELVEIGDSFRVPEIMARSGAHMREVGATNRAHEEDYRAAAAGSAVILKVHRSNFRVSGFTSEVSVARLAALAHEHNLVLLHDLGSGLLLDLQPFGFPDEPLPQQSLGAGADIVTMSGDKLLGGPQAGIVLGRGSLLSQLRRNPMCRAVRVDKLTLAALEATLRLYRDPQQARLRIPALRMLTASAAELRPRAEVLAAQLSAHGIPALVDQTKSVAGGGAFPDYEFDSAGVYIAADDVQKLEHRLRLGTSPVLARVSGNRLVLDMRTIDPAEDTLVERAVLHAWSG